MCLSGPGGGPSVIFVTFPKPGHELKQLLRSFVPVLLIAGCDTPPPTASNALDQDTTAIDKRVVNSVYPDLRPDGSASAGMIWIPGGEFTMGRPSARHGSAKDTGMDHAVFSLRHGCGPRALTRRLDRIIPISREE